ncbi:hypothetical protein C0W42_13655 [Photobacterium kishitanii]|uniref:hypothetical protein n=1 Tax=Photobacterium kishitanii TaxID=318456 RepID=UPI000D1663E3|nr:hypothetical protein [Photobacterium kishitanii]PSU15621.1 hypothetical protein CTM84_20275 [Photobacterium kishitanii]PSU88163.1 hypothetical protein C0W42_13655 [Photobacterium kishitanii]
MEDLFSSLNLKCLIKFMHLSGLAIGLGCAWMLDAFIIKYFKNEISKDKYQLIEFASKFVFTGLALLWISGLLFIAHYYFYAPENLQNQKIWGKLFIVLILTVNGYFVHKLIIPKIKKSVGSTLLKTLTRHEMMLIAAVGAISFVSWLFPIVLGVAKALNFTVSAVDIIAFYFVFLAISAIISNVIAQIIINSKSVG